MNKASLEKQQSSNKNEGSQDHVGVPLLLVNGSRSPEEVLFEICHNDVMKLPSPEEVYTSTVVPFIYDRACVLQALN